MKVFYTLLTICTLTLSSCSGLQHVLSSSWSKQDIPLGTNITYFDEYMRKPNTKSQRMEEGKLIQEYTYIEYLGSDVYATTLFRFTDGILVLQQANSDIKVPSSVKSNDPE